MFKEQMSVDLKWWQEFLTIQWHSFTQIYDPSFPRKLTVVAHSLYLTH
jgi:hypothetical protein